MERPHILLSAIRCSAILHTALIISYSTASFIACVLAVALPITFLAFYLFIEHHLQSAVRR
ncbi:hypothetical protein DL98DRAFT_518191 [Cadophora sp. DSE1049]|nr:hypothetical protein DL98DRAFT_518191 [Cadophora sp. DSE1049]